MTKARTGAAALCASHAPFAFALVSAAINGVITASVGAWLAHTYSTHHARRPSIEQISNLLYERRIRAGMVSSAILRKADTEEVRARKQPYDDTFVAWNTHVRRNLSVIRDVMGDGKWSKLEQDFKDSLVASMADVARCRTEANDARMSGGDGLAVLDGCGMAGLHQFVLDCGSSFINELNKMNRLSFTPFSSALAQGRQLAEQRIIKRCTRAPVVPPPAADQPADGSPAVTPSVASVPAASAPAPQPAATPP